MTLKRFNSLHKINKFLLIKYRHFSIQITFAYFIIKPREKQDLKSLRLLSTLNSLTLNYLTVIWHHDSIYMYLSANSSQISPDCILSFSLLLTKQEFGVFQLIILISKLTLIMFLFIDSELSQHPKDYLKLSVFWLIVRVSHLRSG